MKTLYIDINNEHIKSTNDLIVCQYNCLLSDFYFFLGSKIAEDCVVKSKTELITEFSTTDYKDEFKLITTQWNDLKRVLFGDTVDGIFSFTIPDKFIHWLKFHPQYVSVYDKNFSHKESDVISIDLRELYEETIVDLEKYIIQQLQTKGTKRIIINENYITHKSYLIQEIKKKFDIDIVSYDDYKHEMKEEEAQKLRKQLEQERSERKKENNKVFQEAQKLRKQLEQERSERKKENNKVFQIEGHDYIDLGLPSGVKWATMNIGAKSSNDCGDFFAWGETTSKIRFDKENYEHVEYGGIKSIGEEISMSKYDVAHQIWGGNWRMPTKEECKELQETCEWAWTIEDNMKGYRIKGPNGNSMFFPAGGLGDKNGIGFVGTSGGIWSSNTFCTKEKNVSEKDYSCCMAFGMYGHYTYDKMKQFYGLNIRPIHSERIKLEECNPHNNMKTDECPQKIGDILGDFFSLLSKK